MAATLSAAAVAAGLVLLIGALAGLRQDRQPPSAFGTVSGPAGSAGRPTTASSGSSRTPVRQRPAASPRSSTPPVSSARPALPAAPAAPAALTIPTLQVSARVLPVVNAGGTLGVPDDPAQLGWWNASALPGAASGSVVIDGHVDSAATGPGALFRLGALRAADRIVVTTTAGGQLAYSVTGRRVYPKDAGLPADLFGTAGPARLVLISCGGPFDRDTGSYLDNIVVFAVPVGGTS